MSSSTKTLPLGARIFYENELPVRVEIPLNQHFTRKNDHRHRYQNSWSSVTVALVEARAEGAFAIDMDHPCDLVGWLRRWFRDNYELYETIEEHKGEVVLVIRNGVERLFGLTTTQSGTVIHTPVSRWVIEVTPK